MHQRRRTRIAEHLKLVLRQRSEYERGIARGLRREEATDAVDLCDQFCDAGPVFHRYQAQLVPEFGFDSDRGLLPQEHESTLVGQTGERINPGPERLHAPLDAPT